MGHFRVRIGRTARRLATSWFALVVLLVVLSGGGLFGLTVLQGQVQERADRDAIETARVMAALTVDRVVTEETLTSPGALSTAAITDLNADVQAL